MPENPVTDREVAPIVRDLLRDPIMTAQNVNVYYGEKHPIKNVTLDIGRNQVLALIGPSGCGKSTFLRCLNRMNDFIPGAKVAGRISYHGENLYDAKVDAAEVRR